MSIFFFHDLKSLKTSEYLNKKINILNCKIIVIKLGICDAVETCFSVVAVVVVCEKRPVWTCVRVKQKSVKLILKYWFSFYNINLLYSKYIK